MASKKFGIDIVGSPNTTYDMDKLKNDSRLNSEEALIVQVWNYNPNSQNPEKRSPNPPNLKYAQLWFSKRDEAL